MTRTVVALIVTVLSAAAVYTQSKADEALPTAQQKVLSAWRTCNVAELSKIVTNDFEMIHGSGARDDKTSFLKSVSTCSLDDIRFDISRVRLYGDSAILQGMYRWKQKQGSGGSGERMEVWVKQGGNWMFATHAATASASR